MALSTMSSFFVPGKGSTLEFPVSPGVLLLWQLGELGELGEVTGDPQRAKVCVSLVL